MLSPATDWSENVVPGESERHERLAAQLRELQKRRARRAPAGRGLHYKAHAGLLGELHTLPNLPEWARVGIFAEPGTYTAYARYSSGVGFSQNDMKPDVRGLAVKVVGAPGKKLIESLSDCKTQDFLAILSPSIPVASPESFVGLVLAASGSPLLVLPRLLGVFGFGLFALLPKLAASLKLRPASLSSTPFYSALPIRWGNAAVKYAFVPKAAANGDLPEGRARFAEDLEARLARADIEYELQIQPFVDSERTPIEDPTLEWRPEVSPFVSVGRLRLPQQDPNTERGQKIAAYIERLSFDPWHASDDFRPLGAMMRARKAAYRESVHERGPEPEPDGTEQWGE